MNFYKKFLTSELDTNCYTPDRSGRQILGLVCHDTAGPNDFNSAANTPEAAQFLSDQAAKYLASNIRQVSVHYLVGAEQANAPIYQIVPENFTAYHCGGNPPQFPSQWVEPGTGNLYSGYDLNTVTIGIERFGQVTDIPGPNQRRALKQLVLDICQRNPKLNEVNRVFAHASLEGDRQDGRCWVLDAASWIASQSSMALSSVAPGKVVGPGIRAAAAQLADTVETDEQYCIYNDDMTEASFAWGKTFLYCWRKTSGKISTYKKLFDQNEHCSTVEESSLYRKQPLIGKARSLTRKSDNAIIRTGESANFFYFEDQSTKVCSSYLKG